MKRSKRKGVSTEIECPDCGGTGFPGVRQPVQPGRKIFPPPCKRCFGKGRIESTAMPRGDRGLDQPSLEDAGAEFIPAKSGKGVGVRLREGVVGSLLILDRRTRKQPA